MSSGKWGPFYLGLNVFKLDNPYQNLALPRTTMIHNTISSIRGHYQYWSNWLIAPMTKMAVISWTYNEHNNSANCGHVTPYGINHTTCSTPIHVMACCLMAPRHYMGQSWLLINEFLWHSPAGNFTKKFKDFTLKNILKFTHLKPANGKDSIIMFKIYITKFVQFFMHSRDPFTHIFPGCFTDTANEVPPRICTRLTGNKTYHRLCAWIKDVLYVTYFSNWIQRVFFNSPPLCI